MRSLTTLFAVGLTGGCLLMLATSDDHVLVRVGLAIASTSASCLLYRHARYLASQPRLRNDKFVFLAMDSTDSEKTVEKDGSWTESLIVKPLRLLSFVCALAALLALLGALKFLGLIQL
jgi:hypothetical protein